MLAYSSIAHAGYLMVAISVMSKEAARASAVSAIMFYLLAYALMTMGAFAVLIWLSRRGRRCSDPLRPEGPGQARSRRRLRHAGLYAVARRYSADHGIPGQVVHLRGRAPGGSELAGDLLWQPPA